MGTRAVAACYAILCLLLIVVLAQAQTTTISLTNSVRRSNVVRLGINLGGRDPGSLMKSFLSNPGFEGSEKALNVLADTGSTTTTVLARYWNLANSGGAQPTGYWNDATFHFITGTNQGVSGTITNFAYDGSGNGIYTLSTTLAAPPLQGDVMAVYKTWTTGVLDPRPGSPGVQSYNLSGNTYTTYYDGVYRDIDPSAGKLLLVQGNFNAGFWVKSAAAGAVVNFLFTREQWAGGSLFYSGSYTTQAANNWELYNVTFNVAAGVDTQVNPIPSTKCTPFPSCSRPLIQVQISTTSPAVLIDDAFLDKVSNPGVNPTIFSDRTVSHLKDYKPGVIRFWGGQLGNSLINSLAPPFARKVSAYAPNGSPGGYPYSLHEFLVFCQYIGADPYYVIPPTFTNAEMLGLVDYLAATTGTYATARANLGQTQPWTSVFNKIYLEYGNEIWGGGNPGDPFAGSSMGSVAEGFAAHYKFGVMRSSANYKPNSLVLISGGLYVWSGSADAILQNNKNADLLALAPYYYGSATSASSLQTKYQPLYASFVQDLTGDGPFNQNVQVIDKWNFRNGLNTRSAIYETNFGMTNPGAPTMDERNAIQTGVAGGLSLSYSMLNYLYGYGTQPQCAFVYSQYSFQYENTGAGFPCNYNVTCFYTKIWGLVRDIAGFGTKRPTFLSVESVNQNGILDQMIQVNSQNAQTFTTSGNGLVGTVTMPYVNTFAFKSSDNSAVSVVMYNFHLTNSMPVSVDLSAVGINVDNQATVWQLASNGAEDNNEVGQVVANAVSTATSTNNFGSGYQTSLPPHSLTVVKFTRAAAASSSAPASLSSSTAPSVSPSTTRSGTSTTSVSPSSSLTLGASPSQSSTTSLSSSGSRSLSVTSTISGSRPASLSFGASPSQTSIASMTPAMGTSSTSTSSEDSQSSIGSVGSSVFSEFVTGSSSQLSSFLSFLF